MNTMTVDATFTLFELIQKQLESMGYTYNGAFYRETVDGCKVNPHTNGNIWVFVSEDGPNVYTINLMEDKVTVKNLKPNLVDGYSFTSWQAVSTMTLTETYNKRFNLR